MWFMLVRMSTTGYAAAGSTGSQGLARATEIAGSLAAIAGWLLRDRGEASLPALLALGTVPAMLIGGLAAVPFGERAYEVPVLVLGVLWMALGAFLLRGRYRAA